MLRAIKDDKNMIRTEKEFDSCIKRLFKKRRLSSHKGDNGELLIIAGSDRYPGAAFLASGAGIAALRSGTDLVRIGTTKNVAMTINCLNPDLITIKLDGGFLEKKHIKYLDKEISRSSVILIGPGIGDEKGTEAFVKEIIKKISRINEEKNNRKKTLVIDADALKFIPSTIKGAILTPHKKEWEKIRKRLGKRTYLLKRNNIIVVKGNKDRIISREEEFINNTGNPGMTVGGTGDLLSGLIAGLAARTGKNMESACLGCYALGKIGDKLKRSYGNGFLASDFLEPLARALKKEVPRF